MVGPISCGCCEGVEIDSGFEPAVDGIPLEVIVLFSTGIGFLASLMLKPGGGIGVLDVEVDVSVDKSLFVRRMGCLWYRRAICAPSARRNTNQTGPLTQVQEEEY